jgi:hypothetical protein
MKNKILTILYWIPRGINIFLMLISPMVLILLIVGFVMLLDTIGTQRRLIERLEEVPLTTSAVISFCYAEERYCFSDFVDENGIERYGKLDWRYYSDETTAWLASLDRDDVVEVRYAAYQYEDNIVLVEEYDRFLDYKGHLYQNGGIMLVSWFILMLHPEALLFSLVDDLGSAVDEKMKRMAARR